MHPRTPVSDVVCPRILKNSIASRLRRGFWTLTCGAALATGHVEAQTYNGTIQAGDPIQTTRLFRDETAAVYTTPKANPGTNGVIANRHYDTYSFVNPYSVAIPYQVYFTQPTNSLMTAAYGTAFVPANAATNYLGNDGSSTASFNTFSFMVQPGQTFVLIVNEVNASGAIGVNYTLTLNEFVQTYWRGDQGSVWNTSNLGNTNWAFTQNGTVEGVVPQFGAHVIFSATNATPGLKSTTLGSNITISRLTIQDTGGVTIGGPNTLTIDSPAAQAINVQAGAGKLTISANLALAGAANTITVDNIAGAEISGSISSSIGLVKAGATTLILSGSSTISGTIAVQAGTLAITGPGASLTTGSSDLINISGGNLLVSAGGHLTGGTGQIGATATGTATVTGTGSLWTTNNALLVGSGAGGNGTLTVEKGATVQASQIELGTGGATGAISVTGSVVDGRGVLATGAIIKQGGTTTVDFDGGILRATASNASFLQGFAAGDVTLLSGGLFVDTNGFDIGFNASLDGAGALTKEGVGALSLLLGSSYGGGTTITAGTVIAGANTALGTGDVTMNGGTLAGTGAITLANNLKIATNANFNPGTGAFNDLTLNGNVDLQGAGRQLSVFATGLAAVTFNGVISNDAGGGLVFAKSGGTGVPFITLGGAASNTYTGTTEVNTGVALTLSKTGGAIAIPADLMVHTGSTVTTSQNEQIADTAAVQVEGTGKLQIGSGGSATETIGSLFGDGSVVIGNSIFGSLLRIGSGNFSGSITGGTAGQPRLEKFGPGTLVLSGNNSYQGNLTILGGIVSVGSAANLGAGGLSLEGGELLNTGTLTWTKPVNLFNSGGGTLASALGTTATISGKIDGLAGNTLHVGDAVNTGTVIFSGNNNTYAGATAIDGGTLLVQNTAGSATGTGAVTVNVTGTLGGNGFISGLVTNNGVVSPGNSPGTLTFAGPYVQTSSGTLKIEIGGRNAGEYDLLAVGGTATLSGKVQLLRLNNFQLRAGDHITFLTAAGGVTGKFTLEENEFTTGTIVSGKVVYSSDEVALEAVQGAFTDVPEMIADQYHFSFASGLSPNQFSVANALDNLFKKRGVTKLIEYLNHRWLTELPGDFDRIAPEELTAIYQTAVSYATIQSLNLQRRTDDIRSGSSGFSAQGFALNGQTPSYSGDFGISSGAAGPTGDSSKDSKVVYTPAPENKWGVFLSGTGEWIDVNGDGNARGYDVTTGGFTVGLDYKVTPNLAVGISAGYVGSSADLTNDGRVWTNGGKLGLYGTFFTGGFYTDVAVNGGYNSYDTKRGGLEGAARGSTEGGELNVLFGTGYDCKIGALTVGPTATFNYTYIGFDSYTEHGSLAPLHFRDQNAESMRTAFGFKASYDWKIGGLTIKPELRAAWQHEFADDDYSLDASLPDAGDNTFNVRGPKIGRDSLLLSGGVAVQINDRVATYLYYDGQLGRENYDSHSVTGGIRVAF